MRFIRPMGNDGQKSPTVEAELAPGPAPEVTAKVLLERTLLAAGAQFREGILAALLPGSSEAEGHYVFVGKAVAFAYQQELRGGSASGYDVSVFSGFLKRVRAGESVARYVPDMDLWGRML